MLNWETIQSRFLRHIFFKGLLFRHQLKQTRWLAFIVPLRLIVHNATCPQGLVVSIDLVAISACLAFSAHRR